MRHLTFCAESRSKLGVSYSYQGSDVRSKGRFAGQIVPVTCWAVRPVEDPTAEEISAWISSQEATSEQDVKRILAVAAANSSTAASEAATAVVLSAVAMANTLADARAKNASEKEQYETYCSKLPGEIGQYRRNYAGEYEDAWGNYVSSVPKRAALENWSAEKLLAYMDETVYADE